MLLSDLSMSKCRIMCTFLHNTTLFRRGYLRALNIYHNITRNFYLLNLIIYYLPSKSIKLKKIDKKSKNFVLTRRK